MFTGWACGKGGLEGAGTPKKPGEETQERGVRREAPVGGKPSPPL